ncbi:MAG: hypothetical protein M9963_09415 [Kiritimatiellae bacterium]|nr:hypothetical protein [Kiritimatiellia bacterium]MCO5062193.1 hypothetical protein [Kiritimatiellia bacterium]MCO5068999.1 hypothetical protein [Kiritimatiellia bacterium]MCO6401674.1 hypothetical protein [Verrucomicrobiota bacterium]
MKQLLPLLALGAVALSLVACDWDDDKYRHKPAEGMGALVVDNRTGGDLRVYVDQIEVGKVSAYKDRSFDLTGGVYRVVLEERHGWANWRDDVDIMQSRLTVLDVARGTSTRLDVSVFFD